MGILVLNWLKKHWKWIALAVGAIVLVMYFRQDSINNKALNSLLDNMRQTSEAHVKEIEKLQEINKEKEKELKELDEKYKKQVEILKKEYEDKLSKLESVTNANREEIVKDAYRDPNTLTKKVEEVFGIPYYHEGNK